MKRMFSRIAAGVLSMVLACGSVLAVPGHVRAAVPQSFQLAQAKQLALAYSSSYRKLKLKLNTQNAKYADAVKSVNLKMKNLRSFRWSPLLSLKFPQKPDLAEEYEFIYKPLQVQSEITVTKHELDDVVFQVYEKVSNLFVEVYVLQETAAYSKKRLEDMRDTLRRNRARLVLGQASRPDVERMEKAAASLEEKAASDLRKFEIKKRELSELVNMDVTTQYTFKNPCETASIVREQLEGLKKITMDRDQGYYEAKLKSQMALISMDTNYSLMRSQYGGSMDRLDPYISQAKNGTKIDGDTMKQAYDSLLYDVDSPWRGNIKILFIKIPKEWFKGPISGVRYVEDEPYALFTAIMDYQEALEEEKQMKKDLLASVEDMFETMVNMKNAYESMETRLDEMKRDAGRAMILNQAGEMSYQELRDVQEEYEECQINTLEAMASYTQTLYSFDRLTCGGISAFLYDVGKELGTAVGGNSYLEEELYDGASYYIKSQVEDNAFELGVSVPDDFSVPISHFELWCDGMQIGQRTEADKAIRHLTLATSQVGRVFLRFYNDGSFVDDCEIDPARYQGELQITGGYRLVTKEEEMVGSYTVKTDTVTGMATIKPAFEETEKIAYYAIADREGKMLYAEDEYIPAEKGFSHLSLTANALGELTVICYGEKQERKYEAYFDTANLLLKKTP